MPLSPAVYKLRRAAKLGSAPEVEECCTSSSHLGPCALSSITESIRELSRFHDSTVLAMPGLRLVHTGAPFLRLRSPIFGLITACSTLLLLPPAITASPLELTVNAKVDTDVDASECASSASDSTWIHDVRLSLSDEQKFVPAFVQAGIGEVVRFTRPSSAMTVEQSTFLHPCSRAGSHGELSWDAGLEGGDNQSLLVVGSLDPQWYTYTLDAEPAVCSSGAVFAINPGPTWSAFVGQADKSLRGNVTQPRPSLDVSERLWTSTPPSTTSTGRDDTKSPQPSDHVSEETYWNPWTTTVATVTSFVAS